MDIEKKKAQIETDIQKLIKNCKIEEPYDKKKLHSLFKLRGTPKLIKKIRSTRYDSDYYSGFYHVEIFVFFTSESEIIINYFSEEYDIDEERLKRSKKSNLEFLNDQTPFKKAVFDYQDTLYYSLKTNEAKGVCYNHVIGSQPRESNMNSESVIEEIYLKLNEIMEYDKYISKKVQKKLDEEKEEKRRKEKEIFIREEAHRERIIYHSEKRKQAIIDVMIIYVIVAILLGVLKFKGVL